MELLIELTCWALFQAVAAVLWPSTDLSVRRLQRFCLALLLTGCVATVFGLAVAYLMHSWHALTMFAIALLLFLGAGVVGNCIERKCNPERSTGR